MGQLSGIAHCSYWNVFNPQVLPLLSGSVSEIRRTDWFARAWWRVSAQLITVNCYYKYWENDDKHIQPLCVVSAPRSTTSQRTMTISTCSSDLLRRLKNCDTIRLANSCKYCHISANIGKYFLAQKLWHRSDDDSRVAWVTMIMGDLGSDCRECYFWWQLNWILANVYFTLTALKMIYENVKETIWSILSRAVQVEFRWKSYAREN